eukprot:m.159893 g.159893  ORF g.159893 m.159893 type:complete len:438 (-) comp17613_c0_seq7:1104-2417(-)
MPTPPYGRRTKDRCDSRGTCLRRMGSSWTLFFSTCHTTEKSTRLPRVPSLMPRRQVRPAGRELLSAYSSLHVPSHKEHKLPWLFGTADPPDPAMDVETECGVDVQALVLELPDVLPPAMSTKARPITSVACAHITFSQSSIWDQREQADLPRALWRRVLQALAHVTLKEHEYVPGTIAQVLQDLRDAAVVATGTEDVAVCLLVDELLKVDPDAIGPLLDGLTSAVQYQLTVCHQPVFLLVTSLLAHGSVRGWFTAARRPIRLIPLPVISEADLRKVAQAMVDVILDFWVASMGGNEVKKLKGRGFLHRLVLYNVYLCGRHFRSLEAAFQGLFITLCRATSCPWGTSCMAAPTQLSIVQRLYPASRTHRRKCLGSSLRFSPNCSRRHLASSCCVPLCHHMRTSLSKKAPSVTCCWKGALRLCESVTQWHFSRFDLTLC